MNPIKRTDSEVTRDDARWKDIYEALRSSIESGQVQVGEQCPSEMELLERYGVSRGTVRRALSQLFRDGYIEIHPGQRRVVRKPGPLSYARYRFSNADDESQIHSFGDHLAAIAQAERWRKDEFPKDEVVDRPQRVAWYRIGNEPRLDIKDVKREFGFNSDEEVIWFSRVRFARHSPLVLQWVIVPTLRVPKILLSDLEPGGLSHVYSQCGIVRHSFRAAYAPTLANSLEARYLRAERGTPLILERRISFFIPADQTQPVPYEYLVTLYSERIQIELQWNDSPEARGRRGRTRRAPAKRGRG